MLNAKNENTRLSTGDMDYIRFGSGKKTLIIIPGLGDGFATVKGTALPFALGYREAAKDFTVYVFSRRNNLQEGTTTRDMANDLNEAMDILSLGSACIAGVSQGGMIAQWLAIDHPEKVARLVLVSTLCQPNETSVSVISQWIEMARKNDYMSILLDTADRSYSPARLRTSRLSYRMAGVFTKPKSFERFLIQANACLTHDASKDLEKIQCPTLIIAGSLDKIVTPEASQEMHERIKTSKLLIYEGLSHALYEEAKDFLFQIINFCRP